jgi:hypothetical protein
MHAQQTGCRVQAERWRLAEDQMDYPTFRWKAILFLIVIVTVVLSLQAKAPAPSEGVAVRMVVTASGVADDIVSEVSVHDVQVSQRRQSLKVTGWTPARGSHAGLNMFLLIDDSSDRSLGSQLNELRNFITAQAPMTLVAVGYMRNATVQILQDFTNDHAAAANAVRIPLGNTGAFGSPYLSVIDMMNRWPEHPSRRVIVMVTDGIDRSRGGPRSRGLSTMPDVTRASDLAQRTGTLIYTLFFPGVGARRRNLWEATNGQNGIARLSDESGAESFFLGVQAPVSFRPFLDRIQTALNNQYLLEFRAIPSGRAGLQSVSVGTELPGVELISADGVWVPATQ